MRKRPQGLSLLRVALLLSLIILKRSPPPASEDSRNMLRGSLVHICFKTIEDDVVSCVWNRNFSSARKTCTCLDTVGVISTVYATPLTCLAYAKALVAQFKPDSTRSWDIPGKIALEIEQVRFPTNPIRTGGFICSVIGAVPPRRNTFV